MDAEMGAFAADFGTAGAPAAVSTSAAFTSAAIFASEVCEAILASSRGVSTVRCAEKWIRFISGAVRLLADCRLGLDIVFITADFT